MLARQRYLLRLVPAALGVVALTAAFLLPSEPALAAESTVLLGSASSFAVLAGTGVTNTGPTVLNGDVGTCPTSAITGFPPGLISGANHGSDPTACGAKTDLVASYNDAAGRTPSVAFGVPTDLGGMTLLAGVYSSPTFLAVTGTLTLDAQGDPTAVFIFQAGSTLVTASNSTIALVNGAQACNVFWQVGSSATLGTGTAFVGNIMALTSITATTNATVIGRLLARNGATTLDSNVVTVPTCAVAPPTTTTVAPPTTTLGGPTTTSPAGPTTTTSVVGSATTGTTVVAPPTAAETGESGDVPRSFTSPSTSTSGLTNDVTGRLPRTGTSTARQALAAIGFLLVGLAARRLGRATST